jgi:hypothetical protein
MLRYSRTSLTTPNVQQCPSEQKTYPPAYPTTREIVGIAVRGDQRADGSIEWYASVPECDLLIQPQHLGQWAEALAAAMDEIQRLSGTM